MKVIGKYTKETDQDVLDRSYEFYKKAGFRRELVTSEPGSREYWIFSPNRYPKPKPPNRRNSSTTVSCAR